MAWPASSTKDQVSTKQKPAKQASSKQDSSKQSASKSAPKSASQSVPARKFPLVGRRGVKDISKIKAYDKDKFNWDFDKFWGVDEGDHAGWDRWYEESAALARSMPEGVFRLKVEIKHDGGRPIWRRIVIDDHKFFSHLLEEINSAFGVDDWAEFYFCADPECKQLVICQAEPDWIDPDTYLCLVLKPNYQFGLLRSDSDGDRQHVITVEAWAPSVAELPALEPQAARNSYEEMDFDDLIDSIVHDETKQQGSVDDLQDEVFYLVKVTLRFRKPQVWRRVIVSSRDTLYDLHRQIQSAFAWDDDHLAAFCYDTDCRHDFSTGGGFGNHSFSPNLKIARLVQMGFKFGYLFDFGACWRHIVTFERIVDNRYELPGKLKWSQGDNVPQYPGLEEEDSAWLTASWSYEDPDK